MISSVRIADTHIVSGTPTEQVPADMVLEDVTE